MSVAYCRRCSKPFHYTEVKGRGKKAVALPPPPTCGELHCRALDGWDDDAWQGRSRMALARRGAGIDLDDLDLEALRRFPDPPRNKP